MKNNILSNPRNTENLVRAFSVFGAFTLIVIATIVLINPVAIIPGAEANEAVTSYSRYFASRNIPFALIFLAVALRKNMKTLGYFLLTMGMFKVFDGVSNIFNDSPIMYIVGPTVLGTLFLLTAGYTLKRYK